MAAVAYCLLVFFVLLGVISGVYLLMMLCTRRKKSKGRFIVAIPCDVKPDAVAALLCAARLRLGLMGDLCRSEIIALDCGMDESCRAQCENLCRELDHTLLLGPEELLAYLNN